MAVDVSVVWVVHRVAPVVSFTVTRYVAPRSTWRQTILPIPAGPASSFAAGATIRIDAALGSAARSVARSVGGTDARGTRMNASAAAARPAAAKGQLRRRRAG